MRVRLFLVSFVLIMLPLLAARADEGHHHGPPGEVGTVTFPTSCAADVQKDFEHGVALLHSFWYEGAERVFEGVAARDPQCAMAYWGIAMSRYHPLWDPPSPDDLKKGLDAAQQALAAATESPRERLFAEAVAAFYTDYDKLSHGARAAAYAAAMRRVHESNPGDEEAEIFYALAIRAIAPPADKTYAKQKQAGAMLERIFARQPKHPGLAHYIIHCYDYPALAHLGLDAARRYAAIAPAVPHALHMPSHIFIQLGLWEDAIASNSQAATAAKRQAEEGIKLGRQEQLHAMDYLAYAYLQSGQQSQARATLDEMKAISDVDRKNFAQAYALAAIPARYAAERGDWKAAAALPAPGPREPQATFWTEVARAITYWARAVGAARTGSVSQGQQELAMLQSIVDGLRESKRTEAADQVEVMRLEAASWLALAQGDRDAALRSMREASELEGTIDKHPVTPGVVLPAREQLAELLLQFDQPADALREYQAVLKTSPNRFNGLYGAAQAAEQAGDPAEAAHYYSKLIEVAKPGDPESAQLKRARDFVAKHQARAGG